MQIAVKYLLPDVQINTINTAVTNLVSMVWYKQE